MIRIRYCDLPAGLHIRIEDQGSHTTVWLLPGLTPAQRQAAIRRAKGAARVGQGPELPRPALLRALAADWLRAIIKNGLRAMRLHPAVFFPPLVVLMSAAVAYLLLVSVSIQFLPGPHPQAAGRGPGRPVPQRIRPATGPRHGGGGPAQPPAESGPASPPSPSPSPAPARPPRPSPSPSPTPEPTGSYSPPPTPAPTSPLPSPSSPAPPARQSPLPTKSASLPPVPPPTGRVAPAMCVRYGTTRVCLAGL